MAPPEIRGTLASLANDGVEDKELRDVVREYNTTADCIKHKLERETSKLKFHQSQCDNYTGVRSPTTNPEWKTMYMRTWRLIERCEKLENKLQQLSEQSPCNSSNLSVVIDSVLTERNQSLVGLLASKKDKQTKAAEKAAKKAARALQVKKETKELASFDMEKARQIRVERITNHLLLCNNGVRGDIESFFLEMEHYPKKDVSRILHLISNLKETLEHFIPND